MNKDGAAIYKYMNFNQIEEYVENAKNARFDQTVGEHDETWLAWPASTCRDTSGGNMM